LKELKANKNEKKASKMFLEAVYHMEINQTLEKKPVPNTV
jgi:hypothetical protein